MMAVGKAPSLPENECNIAGGWPAVVALKMVPQPMLSLFESTQQATAVPVL
jgi:hypothetical protein